MKKCIWCKGKGTISLRDHSPILCLNCKGSGEGRDGGTVVGAAHD
jgi:hypothetical protein